MSQRGLSRRWNPNGDLRDRCKARAKSKMRQGLEGDAARCGNACSPGYPVCAHHGAGSPERPGGRPPITGRYSQKLGKFAKAYREALNDKSLLDLREPIALLDSLAQRHAERMTQLDSPNFRRRCKDLYKAMQEAKDAGDEDGASESLAKLGETLQRGAAEDDSMRALSAQLVIVGRVVKDAWDVRLSRKTAINAADLVAVFARFIDIANKVASQLFGEAEGMELAQKLAAQVETDILNRRN